MNSHDESRALIAEQAAWWFLTLQSEDLSELQRVEFVDWLRASPLHISELIRISQLQRELSSFQGWKNLETLDHVNAAQIISLIAPGRLERRLSRGRGYRKALIAAGLVAVCLLGWLASLRVTEAEYRTAVGERREITLPDGSVVAMTPDSDLVVRYRANERLIRLDHGGALFRVAKNPNRPFKVLAVRTQITALGTVFDVARDAQGVAVTVVEGHVAVTQERASPFARQKANTVAPVVSLRAKEQVFISAGGVASDVRRIEAIANVGWDSQPLTFINQTVADVVQAFNQHNQVRIDILDPAIAERRVSGVFQANDPQSFVAFVHDVAGAEVTQPDSQHITLGPSGQRR